MIKDIFIPEKWGSSYLFAKRVLGFDIGRTEVRVTQLYLSGRKILVENFFVEKIEGGTSADYSERAVEAIKRCMQHVKKYDVIHTSLSSAHAVFKELKLPFLAKEKIRMVLNYEVEPLLPFSLDGAVVDFIITKQHPKEKSSEILVAAVQSEHVANHLQLFKEAGLDPAVISIDVFDIYNVYQHTPTYASKKGGFGLIALGGHTTRIAYVVNRQLRFVRILPQGISTHASTLSTILKIEPAQAMEHLLRFGLEGNESAAYLEAARNLYTDFWQQVNFTLNSFTAQLSKQQEPKKLLLLGSGAQLKGQLAFAQKVTGIKCEYFNLKKLLDNFNVHLRGNQPLAHSHIISLGTALPCFTMNERFNLRRKEFAHSDVLAVNKQLAMGSVLFISIIVGLFSFSMWQARELRQEITASSQEIATVLLDKRRFKNIPPEALEALDDTDKEPAERLEELIDEVDSKIQAKKRRWFSFSQQEASLLRYLHELSTQLDKKQIQFTLDRLSINLDDKSIILKGSIPNAAVAPYEELKKLEQKINQSDKLRLTIPPESTEFSLRIEALKTSKGGA